MTTQTPHASASHTSTDAGPGPVAETVVLIHGLWLTAMVWEHWVARYTARGFKVIARSWPGMESDIDALRRDPSGVAALGLTEIVDHYDRIIRALDRPPIIIGHSFGGLVAEILLDRGLGVAGVAIDPAPVKGIFTLPFAQLKSGFPALKNLFHTHDAVALTAEQFHYGFTNHFAKSRAITEFREYPERTHWTIAQDGWEELADYSLEWAVAHATAGRHANSSAAV